jgi:superfamily II DNA or RNA helicase
MSLVSDPDLFAGQALAPAQEPRMPDSPELAPLKRVLPAGRAVVQMLALVGPHLTRAVLAELLRATRAPAPDGKSWSMQKLGAEIDHLVAKGVLDRRGVVPAPLAEALMLDVLRRPDADAFLAVVRSGCPRSYRETKPSYYWSSAPAYADNDLVRAVRLAVLRNDAEEAQTLIALAEREADGSKDPDTGALMLLGCPADPAFVLSREPGLRDRLAAAQVEFLIDFGLWTPSVGRLIAASLDWSLDAGDWPRLDRALMRLDVLAERPDAARARLARLRASDNIDPVLALSIEAALAFLDGAPDQGLPGFREALKQHRKISGRRKLTLPGEFCAFHLLALFAAGDAKAQAEIATLIDIADAEQWTPTPIMFALLELVSGREERARGYAETTVRRTQLSGLGPLDQAAVALALGIIDAGLARLVEDADREKVEQWGAQVPLAVRIMSQTHGRGGMKASAWRERLAALGPGYARDWAEIVPIKPAWERVLDKLEGLLAPAGKPDAKGEAPTATRRLIFQVDAQFGEITPLEQGFKKGAWSGGRAIALKRLHERDEKLDYLTPEDHKVLSAIKLDRTYYSQVYSFDTDRALRALIGHPRVFDAAHPTQAVELIPYPVELVVREKGNEIRIDLSRRADRPAVFLEPESPSRWRVLDVTPDLVELGQVLGSEGLTAPSDARERIIGMIRRDNPRLPIRSELAGFANDAAQGACDPVLQIAPDGEGGLDIRAVVRPLGPDGPAYTTGAGSSSVLAPVAGGGHRRVERDLKAETKALEAVAEACPALAPWRESDHAWRIGTLEDALEALQELHASPTPVTLEWPQGAAIKPTRDVGAKSVSLNISSGKDWFEVKGAIQVDEDLVLDMAEVLARLGGSKGRFVALDDGRYLALTEDLRRRLEAFAAVTEAGKGGRRLGTTAALAVEDLVDGAGSVSADKRWKELMEKLSSTKGFEPELPAGFQAELRDYQRQGFDWLARLSRLGLGAVLADDMGLGKTVQTMALLLAESPKGPSLVAAPTSVCHNWVQEAARFAPGLRVRLLSEASDRKAAVEALGPGDVLVVSYGLLHTESDALSAVPFAVAVFDEAHNLKNADTRRAQASKRIQADFRLALSGTPVENRLDELWSLFDTVTPGLLGSRESFQRRFSGPIERNRSVSARQALKTLVKPFLLRRTKAAVLTELPARTEITLEIEPGAEERAFYEAVRRKALESLKGIEGTQNQKRIRILAEISRLRRAACHPDLIDPDAGVDSAKLAALLELTAELKANRHRALVFSQFTGHLDLVQAALTEAGMNVLRLDGSTPAKERGRLVDAFQAGEGDLFLISLKAGGTGLNLTAADYVIHLDPWWNPAVEDQATDRAHRIGQTRPVTVYRLIAKDSIEEQILALHASKRDLAADFLDGTENTAALDEDALMALIRG